LLINAKQSFVDLLLKPEMNLVLRFHLEPILCGKRCYLLLVHDFV